MATPTTFLGRAGPAARSTRGHWSGPLLVCQTIEQIADAENINPSYVSRLLRMTLLAPEIVEAILAGSHPAGLTRAKVMQPFLMEWQCQVFS